MAKRWTPSLWSCFVAAFSLSLGAQAVDAAQWLDRGPNLGGRLSAIVASPSNASTLVVGSPGGGVFRTTDNGTSWQPTQSYGMGGYTVTHMEWDQIRPGRLLVATYSDLYATTDLGDNFTSLALQGGTPAPLMPQSHVSDPRPFVQLRHSSTESTILWSKPCSGLFYSTDGTTFTQHYPFTGGSSNLDNCIASIAADSSTGRVYFSTMATTGAAHVFRSTCGFTAGTPCLNWEQVSTGLPNNLAVYSLVYTGYANNFAAAVNDNASTVLYVTYNGVNWVQTPGQPGFPSWDARPLFYTTGDQLLLGDVLAHHTLNYGASWINFLPDTAHADVRAFFQHTYDPTHSYLWGVTDGAGTTGVHNIVRWDFTPGTIPGAATGIGFSGLKVWQSYYAAATGTSASGRRRIFLGAQDNGALCSDDGGLTWTSAGAAPSLGCLDLPSLVFAPSNPDVAYSRTCSGTSYARSDNAFSAASCGAVTWTTLTPAIGHVMAQVWTRHMTAVHPTQPSKVYLAYNLHVGVSTDSGATVTPRPLPGGATPVCVDVDGSGALYVGTESAGIYVSYDDGVTYLPFGLNATPPRAVLRITHSSQSGGTIFAATTDGLYRKVGAGAFTLVTGGSGYTVTDVEVDPNCSSRVYTALGFVANLGLHRGGVRVSQDNGATFSSITSGQTIHEVPIADIQVDPVSSRYLHASTYGRGMWTYDLGSTPSCP